MRFGSVCSGIEAASVAWHPLGWEAAWLSEIEPFPCAVLAHHYPNVPNLGDMTTLPERILSGEVEAPDLFCGGTPCQAFSVAGLRNSLGDARGNLSLTFVGIANAIDHVRSVRSDAPGIIFWENVPGVLSTKDNAFGCFLGALAGEDDPLVPPGGKWTNAGCVYGPQRTVAWRVLDAQYFGVAQRRKRVFVVASARADFDPAAVLFEFDGMRRDTAPSREKGQGVAGTFKACASSGGWSNSVDHAAAGYMQPVAHAPEIARCIATREGSSQDWETTTMVAHTLRGEGFDASEDGATAELGDEAQNCLRASSGGDKPHVLCETLYNEGFNHGGLYASTQETYAGKILRTLREAVGEEAFAQWGLGILGSLQSPEILRQALHGLSIRPAAFSRSWVVCCALGCPIYGSGWLLQSLRETGSEGCPPQGWEPSEQLTGELGAYLSELSQPGAQAKRFVCDLWSAAQGAGILREALSAAQEMGRPISRKGQPVCGGSPRESGPHSKDMQGAGLHGEIPREGVLQQARATSSEGHDWESAIDQKRICKAGVAKEAYAVRRLTAEECEFLQGFPRGYTNIPWRKKPESPDGPRYKALGNSWAVPNVRWIGKRIQEALNG